MDDRYNYCINSNSDKQSKSSIQQFAPYKINKTKGIT